MVELSRNAARKTKQVVTEYLARTGRGPGASNPVIFDQPRLGQCLEAISSGSSGDVQLYAGESDTAKGAETSLGEEQTETCYSRGHDFEAGDWALIIGLGGNGLEIIPFSGTSDSGFPPGTGGCDCGHCFQGVTIPDASGPEKCCTSHLQWELVNPWLECEDTDLTLEYAGDANGWLTEPFDGPDCDGNQNEYRWQLSIDVEGRSYLTLVLETDNGCDPVCVIFGRDSFDCQCDNQFSLLKPYGTWIGVDRSELSCSACLKPVIFNDTAPPADCHRCDTVYPLWTFSLDGVTNGTCAECDDANGAYALVIGPVGPFGDQNFRCSASNEEAHCRWFAQAPDGDTGGCGADAGPPCGAAMMGYSTGGTNGYVFVYHEGMQVGWHIPFDDFDCDGENELTLYHDIGWCENVPDTITITPHGNGLQLAATSSGVCDETCDPTPAPVDPDPGACCYEGVCYDNWEESLCNSFGAEWDAGGCGDCGEPGVCCIGGDCLTGLHRALCENGLGGTFTVGGSCSPNPCVGGACCRSDGSCDQAEEADCQGVDEWYHGDGTDCADFDCNMTACCSGPPIPPGNCSCTDQTWAGCFGGTEVRLGRGTTCADPDGYTCTNYPSVDCGWDPP